MQFRRSGQRDERRRRVLIEEANSAPAGARSASTPEAAAGAARGGKPYASEARAEYQPRLTDLIPQRIWKLLLLVLLSGLAVAGLQAAYLHAHQAGSLFPEAALRVLDLQGPGNLVAWFAALVLLGASVGCLEVYLLRRHKADDYRGRYRIWLWTAAWLLLASVDAASGLHHLGEFGLQQLAAWPAWMNAVGVWWVLLVMVSLVLGIRVALDIRDSLLASLFLLIALVSYAVTAAAAFGVLAVEQVWQPLVQSSALLSGHLGVAFAIWTFARHAVLQAHQEPAAPRRARKRAQASGKPAAKVRRGKQPAAARRVDAGHSVPSPSHSSRTQKATETKEAVSAVAESSESTPQAEEAGADESRAERKRLRKQRRRERRRK